MERIRRFFRRLGKTLNAKGYTLLEVAAVVAVTGTLAAVAMPVVSDKIAAGKILGAQQDVQAIKDSIVAFMKDTGVPPFYTAASGGLALPKENADTFVWVLATRDGVAPLFSGTGADWAPYSPDTNQAYRTIDGQIIDNIPLYLTLGTNAWKGPYVPSLKKDPWGNKYFVAIRWLAEPVIDLSGKKYQKAVYVISAGPNGLIETSYSQKIRVIEGSQEATPFTVVNDDIVSRIN